MLLDLLWESASIALQIGVVLFIMGGIALVGIFLMNLVDWKEWSVIRKRKQADRRWQREQRRLVKQMQRSR